MASTPLQNHAAPPFLAFISEEASLQAARELAAQSGWTPDCVYPGTILQAITYLQAQPSPAVLLVELTSAAEAPAQLNRLADLCDPATQVIATSGIDEFSFYSWLREIGIDHYLLQPFTLQSLQQSLARRSPPQATENKQEQGRVIAFLGTRGGVGTTTLATHFAHLLARKFARSTALLDMDAHFGSCAMAFDIEPSRGLHTLFENPERVDGLFLDRVMIKPGERLAVLSAEEPLKELLAADARAAELLYGKLREKHACIVVDVPRVLTPLTRALLGGADHTVLVTEPSLLGLRDLLRLHDYLKDGLHKPAPLVIVNREGLGGKQEMKRHEFAKHYGHAIEGHIPFLPEIMAATARGEMLTGQAKHAAVLNPLHALAAKLTDARAAQAKPAGTLARLLKGK